MQHKPLADIRKYALITDSNAEFYAVVKPEGLDVYINDGKIYDFNHNELKNQYLKFHFEKLLATSINMKMTAMGTLTAPNILNLLKHKHTLYEPTRSTFPDIIFNCQDVIFPVFDAEHVYKWRYTIVDKVVGVLPNCRAATYVPVKNEIDLRKFVTECFTIDTSASVVVYRTDCKFVPGMSQLTFEAEDVASYIVEANQRFRAHVKAIGSTTIRMDNGDKYDVAQVVVAKFKKDFVEIPVDQTNFAFRKFLWDNRRILKGKPFWFTGYTLLTDKGEFSDYETVINKFLAFIPDATVEI